MQVSATQAPPEPNKETAASGHQQSDVPRGTRVATAEPVRGRSGQVPGIPVQALAHLPGLSWVTPLDLVAASALVCALALSSRAALGLQTSHPSLTGWWQLVWREPLLRAVLLLAAIAALGHIPSLRRSPPGVAVTSGALFACLLVVALNVSTAAARATHAPDLPLKAAAFVLAAAVTLLTALMVLHPHELATSSGALQAWLPRVSWAGLPLPPERFRPALWRGLSTIMVVGLTWLGLHLALATSRTGPQPATASASSVLGVELTILYVAAALWNRWPSRGAAIASVSGLALCPIVQLRFGEASAEQLATFVYLVLWIAVLQGMWELWRERRQVKLPPGGEDQGG